MEITQQEFQTIAQYKFEDCFKDRYSVCGFSSFLEILLGEDVTKDSLYSKKWKNSPVAKLYNELRAFHCIDLSKLSVETKGKLVVNTAMLFSAVGYPVDATKINIK